jgi:hypothetical protein
VVVVAVAVVVVVPVMVVVVVPVMVVVVVPVMVVVVAPAIVVVVVPVIVVTRPALTIVQSMWRRHHTRYGECNVCINSTVPMTHPPKPCVDGTFVATFSFGLNTVAPQIVNVLVRYGVMCWQWLIAGWQG